MSYPYETMRQIYLAEKERRLEEQRRREKEKMDRTIQFMEKTILEAVKNGDSKVVFICKRMLDEKKKPMLDIHSIGVYIQALQEKFPDIQIKKETRIANEEDMIFCNDTEVLIGLTVSWEKFEPNDEEGSTFNQYIS
jgi:hypothetical protein